MNVISAIHAALGEPNKAKDGDFGSNSALWYGQWLMADKKKVNKLTKAKI